jgi:hypothetical protein
MKILNNSPIRRLFFGFIALVLTSTTLTPSTSYGMVPGKDEAIPSDPVGDKPPTARSTPAQMRQAEEKKLSLAIPPVAKGHEAIYQRFLKGVLVYRPEPGSDVGKVEMPIAALANPLEGTFDLSRCGDTENYLSIATGYRKGMTAANAEKVEIWITPRFLIEENLEDNASHFNKIMSNWDATKAPLGAFFNYGGWDNLELYDYATTQDFETFSKENFYGKWDDHLATASPVLIYATQSYLEKVSCSFPEVNKD